MLLDSCVESSRWLMYHMYSITQSPDGGASAFFFLQHFSYYRSSIKYMQFAHIINIFLTTTWLAVILADVIVHVILSDIF